MDFSENDEGDSMDANSESRDDVDSFDGNPCPFADEETKSRFTEYSMSSSVMRRNDQLSLLDQRFEKVPHIYSYVLYALCCYLITCSSLHFYQIDI